MRACVTIAILAVAVLLSPRLHATGADTATVPPSDTAPCMAAIAANDDDKVLGACGAVIDNEKTAKPDRLKALVARAGAFTRKDQTDRAIADYDAALRLHSQEPDLVKSRGA